MYYGKITALNKKYMSIIERIKKLLSTPEARHLKEEVVGTASDLASKTKEVQLMHL